MAATKINLCCDSIFVDSPAIVHTTGMQLDYSFDLDIKNFEDEIKQLPLIVNNCASDLAVTKLFRYNLTITLLTIIFRFGYLFMNFRKKG
jgi:hypothetical protein